MTYSLNKDGAKQANKKLSGYIDKNGDYLLKIELAEWIAGQATKQSRGIRLYLIDANKAKASIDLWFQKGDGTRNDMSANMLDGLMTCVSLQNLSEATKTIEGKIVNTCPELQGKVFGALIQTEKHAYMKDGERKEIDKPLFYAVYQYKTKLTPDEIMNSQTSAVEIVRLSESLSKAKPRFTKEYKELNASQQTTGYGSLSSGNQNHNAVDLDDDLPF